MPVVGTYPKIPVRPEPSFWCGWREQLRPNARGDLPPPLMLTSAASIDRFDQAYGDWEVRPLVAGMTRDDARAFQRREDAAIAWFVAELGVDPDLFARQGFDFDEPTTTRWHREHVATHGSHWVHDNVMVFVPRNA